MNSQPILVFPKIGGKTTKMDGENNGKPYFLMDDLGGKPTFYRENIHMPALHLTRHDMKTANSNLHHVAFRERLLASWVV